jgi:cytochrome P450
MYPRNLGGTILEGADTSSATLQGVILVLVAYPRVQQKLREEMDRVVGSERAPQWDDLPNLPYLQAFINEVRCLYITRTLLSMLRLRAIV